MYDTTRYVWNDHSINSLTNLFKAFPFYTTSFKAFDRLVRECIEFNRLVVFTHLLLHVYMLLNLYIHSKLNQILKSFSDEKIIDVCKLIHAVFPPAKILYSKDKSVKNYKPSVEASFESFLKIVTTASQIKEYLVDREKKMSQYNQKVQPQIFLVQDASQHQGKYVVVYDEYYWRFNEILKAFHTTIEIYFMFNLAYPFESERFYSFMSKYFFGIGSTQDTKMLSIITKLTHNK